MAYIEHLIIMITIFSLLSVSLNLVMGYTGLLNLGHMAFYGIGAYVSALVTLPAPIGLGLPFIVGLISAGVVAGFFGFLIGLPTMRLKGDYLAIATLGFLFIVHAFAKNLTWLTRGPMGLPGVSKPSLIYVFNSQLSIIGLYAVIAFVGVFVMYRVIHGPFGRILVAVREDELAVMALGKNTVKFKIMALVIGSFFAGIAGSMYVHYIGFIDPSEINILNTVLVLCMVVIGGLGSIIGSVVGSIIIILLPELVKTLNLPSESIGALRIIVFSLLLIIFMMFRPRGIFGERRFLVKDAKS